MSTLRWRKRGFVYGPDGGSGWMKTHAQVPTALVKDDRLRVYFSSRPRQDLSLTTYVDLDIQDLSKTLYLHPDPILQPGEPGAFDEHGIMPACAVEVGGAVFLYYSGWSHGRDVPYRNYTGLAISEDGGATFRKHSSNPVLDRTAQEIHSATSPLVVVVDNKWHMWYSSGTHWLTVNGKSEHTYDLKYARSGDGVSWTRTGESAVAQRDKFEAITRPAIARLHDGYHMWFSYRGSANFRGGADSYRLGYAFSEDLVSWTRDDEKAGIECSSEGWDSSMMAYPCIVRMGDETIMLYNGNDFGLGGFGYATLEVPD